jgi:hypothetical protein
MTRSALGGTLSQEGVRGWAVGRPNVRNPPFIEIAVHATTIYGLLDEGPPWNDGWVDICTSHGNREKPNIDRSKGSRKIRVVEVV